jgi:mannosyltransferase OCH1-like enzyme
MALLQKVNYLRSYRFFALFALLIATVVQLSSYASIVKVDFDKSMGIEERGRFNLMFNDPERSDKFYHFYKNLYNKNIISEDIDESLRIPKIIHQIWIGPKPFPELYELYAGTCKSVHPGWKYILWTNKDVESVLAINQKYKRLYKEYEKHGHFSGQKDILEYLILYKHGGVFLDADIECKKSFSEIQRKYDFFSALEPANRWSPIPIMTNAIIGTKKNDQIFIDTLDMAVKKYDIMYDQSNTGYRKIIRSIKKILGMSKKSIRVPDQRLVLMSSLGENFVENNTLYNEQAIVFPATYFNPIMPQVGRYDVLDEIKYRLGIYKNKGKTFTKVKDETIAVQDFYD